MNNVNEQPVINHAARGFHDVDKRKMIQNQLIILIHAAKCQIRLRNNPQNNHGPYYVHQNACRIPHCQTMKTVLEHLPNCTLGRACTVQHCSSSRHIIAHWKQCRRQDCAVCQPLKDGPANLLNDVQLNEIPPVRVLPGYNLHVPVADNVADDVADDVAAWRTSVTSELREHIAKKIAIATAPPLGPPGDPQNDDGFTLRMEQARVVEQHHYGACTTRESYYKAIAHHIYNTQKSLQPPTTSSNTANLNAMTFDDIMASNISTSDDKTATRKRTIDAECDQETIKKLKKSDEENKGKIKDLESSLKSVAESGPGVQIDCPICLDNYWQISIDRKILCTPCGHMFCNKCLKQALDTSHKCPKCTRGCHISLCHPIYFS